MGNEYKGEIAIPQDGLNNRGTIFQLVDYVNATVDDYTRNMSEKEQLQIKCNTKMTLDKILNTESITTPAMKLANFEIESLIGVGAFARVWKAKGVWTGPVAIKQLPISQDRVPEIFKERDVMIKLKHPNICNILGAFYDRDAFMVLELCHGSVAHLRNRISSTNAVRFGVQLLEAVQWMHQNNIVHADIKPDNCLIKQDNTLVVSNFGNAFLLNGENSEYRTFERSHGNLGYQDLNALKHFKFGKENDVFAAACVLFEMDTKGAFFLYSSQQEHTRDMYVDAIENGRVINLPTQSRPEPEMPRESLSDRAHKSEFGFLIRKMIQQENRITAGGALIDDALRMVLFYSDVNPDTPSLDKDYVTREFNMDTSMNFSFCNEQQQSNPIDKLTFSTFYFDEQDVGNDFSVVNKSDPSAALTPTPGRKDKKTVCRSPRLKYIIKRRSSDSSDLEEASKESADDESETDIEDVSQVQRENSGRKCKRKDQPTFSSTPIKVSKSNKQVALQLQEPGSIQTPPTRAPLDISDIVSPLDQQSGSSE